MQNPIIVTEVPRSGADLVALSLSTAGVWVGDGQRRPEDKHRFGNKEIQTTLVRPMLRGLRADSIGMPRFPELAAIQDVAPFVSQTWKRKIEDAVHAQGCHDGAWCYCGADAAMLWPIWMMAFPHAQWVIVRRDENGIIESCERTVFVGKTFERKTISAWIGNYVRRFNEIMGETASAVEIWPGMFLKGDLSSLRDLHTRLGLQWNDGAARDALTPVLWGNGVFQSKGAA